MPLHATAPPLVVAVGNWSGFYAGVVALSNRLTVKAEYWFVDLGHTSTTFPLTLAVSTMAATSSYQEHLVRAGFNFKFGGL